MFLSKFPCSLKLLNISLAASDVHEEVIIDYNEAHKVEKLYQMQ